MTKVVEYLGCRHLGSVNPVTGVDIFTKSVRDSGIEHLLLILRPVFVAAELLKFAQSDQISRLIWSGLRRHPTFPGYDQRPDQEGQQDNGENNKQIRKNLRESHRIFDLSLDVVNLECGGVDRDGEYLQLQWLEHNSVKRARRGLTHDREGRQEVFPFLKGSYDHRKINVTGFRGLLRTISFERVHLPRTDDLHTVPRHEPL